MTPLRATYRLQLGPGLGFRDARELVRDYIRFTDKMFYGPAAHGRIRNMQRPGTMTGARTHAWYELS